jgi:uncharacterized lipoprotein YddW (UPF0748 family)
MTRAALALVVALAAGCASLEPAPGEPPPVPREFRGAWVATVANIDWPSRRDLSPAEQRAEIVAIADLAQKVRLNALIVQVRPSADAIYPSALEPWTEYLTGEQGRAPDPPWDPLQVWIDEAHRRGIELHAWFNPYRARQSKAQSPEAPSHIARVRPELVRSYGNQLWLDPGEPAAAQRTLDVILDVVRRYDIDGVHIDDYFYPYPVSAPSTPGGTPVEVDFPDETTWSAYLATGGTLAKADWRRRNVTDLVERIYREVHREKAWVRFGISPFGLGKPERRPAGVEGFSQYDKLYADVELWMQRCWLDYLAPQLYWKADDPARPFVVLLDTWIRENACGRHVFPGFFTSRIDASPASWRPQDILEQIALVRARKESLGHIHFSMAALIQNRSGINEALAAMYPSPALVPEYPWLGTDAPGAPVVTTRSSSRNPARVTLQVVSGPGTPAARFAIWTHAAGVWRLSIAAAEQAVVDLAADAPRINRVVVSGVDRLGNEGPRTTVMIP